MHVSSTKMLLNNGADTSIAANDLTKPGMTWEWRLFPPADRKKKVSDLLEKVSMYSFVYDPCKVLIYRLLYNVSCRSVQLMYF